MSCKSECLFCRVDTLRPTASSDFSAFRERQRLFSCYAEIIFRFCRNTCFCFVPILPNDMFRFCRSPKIMFRFCPAYSSDFAEAYLSLTSEKAHIIYRFCRVVFRNCRIVFCNLLFLIELQTENPSLFYKYPLLYSKERKSVSLEESLFLQKEHTTCGG